MSFVLFYIFYSSRTAVENTHYLLQINLDVRFDYKISHKMFEKSRCAFNNNSLYRLN